MDFYSLDYIFAETQFTSGLHANLQRTYDFVRQPVGPQTRDVTSTFFCDLEVDQGMPDHLAAQAIIDKGISHFTEFLKKDSVQGIKFTRIEVLKAFACRTGSGKQTLALVIDYTTPAKRTIKSFV